MTTIACAVVGGERVRRDEEETFDSVNPATEDVIAQIVTSSASTVDAAIDAATRAQPAWAGLTPDARGQALWRWGERILADAERLAATDTSDIGRPIRDSRHDPATCARALRYWAGMADQIRGEQLPTSPGHLTYTLREPIGVIAVVLPWNGPMQSLCNRVAPALACGNAVVVKPSEWSPLSAGLLAEHAVAAGIPPGVVNVVLGDGLVGARLVSHSGVGAVTFTGSVPTGRRIAQAAAGKTVTMELGGKSPNIVFADADLDTAARAAVFAVFANSGQVCCAGTRLIVHRSIATAFVDRVCALAGALRIGDPTDPDTDLGPVASRPQFEKVSSYLAQATEAGARMALGGQRHDGTGQRGFFVEPTVVCDAGEDSPLVTEEIFGPVLVVQEFEDEEEAVALANATRYGLAANIWTENGSRMLRVAAQIEAGTIWGNTSRVMDPALPFGGFKDSGIGNAWGDGAIAGSTRLKRVSVRYGSDAPVPAWPDRERLPTLR